jgi:hypothetical protein
MSGINDLGYLPATGAFEVKRAQEHGRAFVCGIELGERMAQQFAIL